MHNGLKIIGCPIVADNTAINTVGEVSTGLRHTRDICGTLGALFSIFCSPRGFVVIVGLINLNKQLKKLKVTLAELEDEGENMTKLIREIDNLEPVSGYGLFTMDRTTLTSMISVSITYIIILVQFKQNFVANS